MCAVIGNNLSLEIADISCCNLVYILAYIIEDIVWKQVGILLRPYVLAPSWICIFHVRRHKRSLEDRHIHNQKSPIKLKPLLSCLYYKKPSGVTFSKSSACLLHLIVVVHVILLFLKIKNCFFKLDFKSMENDANYL